MTLISFIVICVVVGLVVWGCQQLPLPPQIQQLILVAAIIVLVLLFLSALGLVPLDIAIPRIR